MNSKKKHFRLQIETIDDVIEGWRFRHGWKVLAAQSIQTSYKRTVLGPFWISIQQIIFILGMGFVYSQLFDVSTSELIPIIAFGVSIWSFISHLIMNGANVYILSASEIKSSDLPLTFYIFRSLCFNFYTYLHSSLSLICIPILFDDSPSLISVITTPILISVLLVNGLFFSMWLAPICTRYRDVATSIQVFVLLLFLCSPIHWESEQLIEYKWIADLNPIAWFVESFRNPLLGKDLKTDYIILIILLTIANSLIGTYAYGRFKSRIKYWI